MAVDEKVIPLIHGIKIEPSQPAQDLLAAFHLGAMTVLAALSPQSIQGQQRGPEQVIVNTGGMVDDDMIYGEATLPDIMGMDPLRREAMLSAYGLTVAGMQPFEPDPTAANLAGMMESEGIPTKPGPGGAVARHYSEEGETD